MPFPLTVPCCHCRLRGADSISRLAEHVRMRMWVTYLGYNGSSPCRASRGVDAFPPSS